MTGTCQSEVPVSVPSSSMTIPTQASDSKSPRRFSACELLTPSWERPTPPRRDSATATEAVSGVYRAGAERRANEATEGVDAEPEGSGPPSPSISSSPVAQTCQLRGKGRDAANPPEPRS